MEKKMKFDSKYAESLNDKIDLVFTAALARGFTDGKFNEVYEVVGQRQIGAPIIKAAALRAMGMAIRNGEFETAVSISKACKELEGKGLKESATEVYDYFAKEGRDLILFDMQEADLEIGKAICGLKVAKYFDLGKDKIKKQGIRIASLLIIHEGPDELIEEYTAAAMLDKADMRSVHLNVLRKHIITKDVEKAKLEIDSQGFGPKEIKMAVISAAGALIVHALQPPEALEPVVKVWGVSLKEAGLAGFGKALYEEQYIPARQIATSYHLEEEDVEPVITNFTKTSGKAEEDIRRGMESQEKFVTGLKGLSETIKALFDHLRDFSE